MTVQPGLHSLYNAGSSGTICDLRNGRTGLATGFAATRLTVARLRDVPGAFAAALPWLPTDCPNRSHRFLLTSRGFQFHRRISRLSSCTN